MLEYRAAYYQDKGSGWYMAKVLDFPGVVSQGRTLDRARRMLADALREMTEWLLEDGQPIPRPDPTATDPGADVLEPIRLLIRARPDSTDKIKGGAGSTVGVETRSPEVLGARHSAGARARETMSTQITLTLPETVLARAECWARRMGRPVDQVLAQVIESSLAPLGPESEQERPVTAWSDEEVLAATDLQLSAEDDGRLSELLQSQQAGPLTGPEQAQLSGLMLAYQQGLLRKAQALSEAVRRGLREPLAP
jgi:predicted RNase H-like HicB family nuclease